MTYTNFPDGITSFGVPTFGVGGLLPFTGQYFWVNETTGSDGGTGAADDPFATLARALSLCINNNNDVIFLTGTAHVSATVAWNLNRTHLIGLCWSAFSLIREPGFPRQVLPFSLHLFM